jgi:hypothetical protein
MNVSVTMARSCGQPSRGGIAPQIADAASLIMKTIAIYHRYEKCSKRD